MLVPGDEIDGYKIDEKLGEGGMGVVYRATQLALERPVALKVLSARLGQSDEILKRFRREALMQGQMTHPHIVPVHDFGEVDGDLYLVMRLIDGVSLKSLVVTEAPSPGRSLSILRQVSHALDAAHLQGLVHRDVKPENILIEKDDTAYLADFGLTRLAAETGLTASGMFVGTLHYAAPEQINGSRPSPAMDVYSLTAVLYECLTGSVPFPKEPQVAVMFAHMSDPPPRVTDLRPELPEEIDAVVSSGMAKDPADRPATADDLILAAGQALADVMSASQGPKPRATTSAGSSSRAGAHVDPSVGGRVMPADNSGGFGGRARRFASAGWIRVLAGVLVVALAGVAGVMAASATTSRATTVRTASSTEVAFRYSDPEFAPSPSVRVPGLPLIAPIAVRSRSSGLTLVGGLSAVSDPTLLPEPMRVTLARPLAPGSRVEIRNMQALRYEGLAIPSAGIRLTAVAVPTSSGAAVVLCIRSTALTAEDEQRCETIASTLVLHRAKPLRLAPTIAYAQGITAALKRLRSARSSLFLRLSRAHRPAAQAAALEAFAGPCEASVEGLKRLPAGPQEEVIQHRITSSAEAMCSSYKDVASAARAGARARYDAAREKATDAEHQLERAVKSLRSLGYKV